MMLSQAQNERFYRAWFGLMHYANERLKLADHVPRFLGDGAITPAEAIKVRDAIWADDALRYSYIAENPAGLSAEELALVQSWDQRVAGRFFIMKHLKKYSIFLSEGSPAHAYGVLGLMSSFKEMVAYLPIMVNATLLPFGDQIIYDGLISTFSVSFGPGIRADLKDTLRDAQEREGITTSLLPTSETDMRGGIKERNAKLLKAFRQALAASNLSEKMIEEHTRNVVAFANDYLLARDSPRGLVETTSHDVESYISANLHTVNMTSFKRFARFMRGSGRMDWDEMERILKFLK